MRTSASEDASERPLCYCSEDLRDAAAAAPAANESRASTAASRSFEVCSARAATSQVRALGAPTSW